MKSDHVLNLSESVPFLKNLSSVSMAELEAKEAMSFDAFNLAVTVHMGLVPVYVCDEVADSRLCFAPRGMGRDRKHGIGASLRVRRGSVGIVQ